MGVQGVSAQQEGTAQDTSSTEPVDELERDAVKAGRADSPTPKAHRQGSASPPDTAVGKDTSAASTPAVQPSGPNISTKSSKQQVSGQQLKKRSHHCQQQQYVHMLQEEHSMQSSGGGNGDDASSSQLLQTHPVVVSTGLLSHSLDSLDTLLLDTDSPSSTWKEEKDAPAGAQQGLQQAAAAEQQAGSVAARDHAGDGGSGAGLAAASASAPPVRASASGCVLNLEDLLAIVLDVLHDKRAADKRCVCRWWHGLSSSALTCACM